MNAREEKDNNKPKIENINTSRFPLAQLPRDVIQTVGNYLSSAEVHMLSRMGNRHLFFATLPGSMNAIKQLLLHVVRGEKNEAEAMLAVDPSLLLYKATVTDYSLRKIHGTAWQIAAGAQDISIDDNKFGDPNAKPEEMVEMIERYLKMLPNGELELAKQKAQQFPDGWETNDRIRMQNDFRALTDVFEALALANTDQECEAALDQFRQYLQPSGVLTTGKHFNAKLLVDAFKLYDQYYERFGGWHSTKNNYALRQVIGEIEFNLPACYAQAFCDGLNIVLSLKTLPKRSLTLWDQTSYYTRNTASQFGLGLDSAVLSYSHASRVQHISVISGGYESTFAKLYREKTAAFEKMLKSRNNSDNKLQICTIS